MTAAALFVPLRFLASSCEKWIADCSGLHGLGVILDHL